MASTVLDRALAREAQLIEELEKVRQFIALYHRFEGHEVAETTALTSAPAPIGDLDPPATTVKPREAIRIVLDMLRNYNKPLSTRTIFDLLEERSIRVTGKNPINNLSAALSYDGRVRSTSAGWVVAEDVGAPDISGAVESKASQPMRTGEALQNKENRP